MCSQIRVTKRRSFSAIPDDILEDVRMRPETRLVLGWLIGRPDGWEVRVGHVRRTLGLTERRWAKARNEMEECGYLQQIQRRDKRGKFIWEHIVSDSPTTSIPPKPRDGKTMDGKPGRITTSPEHQESNTPLNPPAAISCSCIEKARERFPGYDIEALEREWRSWLAGKEIVSIKNYDSTFLAWAGTYTMNNPLPFSHRF